MNVESAVTRILDNPKFEELIASAEGSPLDRLEWVIDKACAMGLVPDCTETNAIVHALTSRVMDLIPSEVVDEASNVPPNLNVVARQWALTPPEIMRIKNYYKRGATSAGFDQLSATEKAAVDSIAKHHADELQDRIERAEREAGWDSTP